MKVSDLINQLIALGKPDAEITLLGNIGNSEDENTDIYFNNIEVWNDGEETITLFVGVNEGSEPIQQAKKLLRDNGNFIDNLWCVDDVRTKFDCTDEEAQDVLLEAMTNEATMEQIWFSIGEFGRIDKLKENL